MQDSSSSSSSFLESVPELNDLNCLNLSELEVDWLETTVLARVSGGPRLQR